ncbi:MAG: hypothetical protein P4L85_05160 [Paludisphaera borealis]|uniref:hypothetical protein n=1 Tax=Paludisphaera borealis TaxID=1387353 RepID=UPI002846C986|nr:hypothetical protein [Paludisphaera borealis]MDR3618720.1 hypothetical protein [Paludisphaera borealis]
MTMDAPEVDPAEPLAPPSAITEDVAALPRLSFLKAVGGGAKAGFRAFSLVFGPFALLAAIAGLVPTLFALGAGRGFELHTLVVRSLLFGLASVLFGMVVGAAAGLIVFLIDRARGPYRTGTWRSIADRPIRFFPGRRPEAAVVDPPRPRRRRRWPWLIGVPALLILATAFGAGMYAGRYVDRRLAAAIAATDRDDPGWRLDDLMAAREPVADEDNSALVVAEVVAMMPEGWPGSPPTQPGMPKPPPSEAEPALKRLAELESNIRMDDETADAVRAELAQYADAVELARTIAEYDRGEHELEVAPNPINTLLTETQEGRLVPRLLAADAAIRAHDGDVDGALDSCRAILGVGRSLGDEPFLISMLVRASMGQAAMDSARRVLAQGEPSDDALAMLQADLRLEEPQTLLIRGMRGERANLDELIRRIRDREIPLDPLGGKPSPGDLISVIAPWGTVMLDHQRALALEWMNELVSIAHKPVLQRPPLFKAWKAELLRVKATRFWSVTAAFPVLMMPAFDKAERALTRYQASLGASIILCAAERHRRKTGGWPESVAAIGPGFLPDPPVDPFSGEPFRVERRDGRFLVHSVGPNLKDEHGAFEAKRWLDGGPDDVGTGAWDPALRRRPPAE